MIEFPKIHGVFSHLLLKFKKKSITDDKEIFCRWQQLFGSGVVNDKSNNQQKIHLKVQHDLNINSQIEFVCLMSSKIYTRVCLSLLQHYYYCQINVFIHS